MKVVFIGCVESSAIFLRTLLQENANIVGIITKKNQNLMLILWIYQILVKK